MRGRIKAKPSATAIDVIKENAEDIGFGEWKIRLVIHDGKITGFDEMETPLLKFREKKER